MYIALIWLVLLLAKRELHVYAHIDHVCLHNLQVKNDAVNDLPPGPFRQQMALEDYYPQSPTQNSSRYGMHCISYVTELVTAS